MPPKFRLGQVVITRGIGERMQKDRAFSEFVRASITRLWGGDWGDLVPEDAALNDSALTDDPDQASRLLSVYDYAPDADARIWIITEWDRSATTVLFPDEY